MLLRSTVPVGWHEELYVYENKSGEYIPVITLRSKSISTHEKINARMFFIAAYVAQPTDDRLQQANKEDTLIQVKDVG